MSVATIKTDIKALFLEREDCDAGTVQQLRGGLGQGPTQYKALREAADVMQQKLATATGAAAKKWQLKLGIALHFLGKTQDAATHLRQAEGALAQFYLGRTLTALGEYEEAEKAFDRAEKAGYTGSQVQLQRAGIYRQQDNFKHARAILANLEELSSHSAEYHFQVGSIALEEGDRPVAIRHFERSVELDPNHSEVLFELGYLNDLHGNDDEAMSYYERSAAQLPAHLGAVTNLGILYEDHNQFDKAYQCFHRILSVRPTDERALLFFRDVQSAKTMYYDEDAERTFDKFAQVLEVPVTDFELSVRSRNCLRKMNIKTLGDLTRIAETELLSSKNFGETSLDEIKQILASKGLRLGQSLEEGSPFQRFRFQPQLTEEEQAALGRSVADLNLSVRARKCMNRLGISSLKELVSRTADELLETKNFGMTSLNEVREKLGQIGLKLRGD